MVQSALVILQETARWKLLWPQLITLSSYSYTFYLSLVTFNHLLLPVSLRLPSAGGVYSPGYAFADTTLVARFSIIIFWQKTISANCQHMKCLCFSLPWWFFLILGWTRRMSHSHLWLRIFDLWLEWMNKLIRKNITLLFLNCWEKAIRKAGLKLYKGACDKSIFVGEKFPAELSITSALSGSISLWQHQSNFLSPCRT